MSRPPQFSDEELDRAHDILKGRDSSNPIKSRELEETLGMGDADGHPNTRALITAVMQRRRLPIVATNNGYFVPHSYDEVQDYMASLDKRINGMVWRKATLLVAFQSHQPDKMPSDDELFEDTGED